MKKTVLTLMALLLVSSIFLMGCRTTEKVTNNTVVTTDPTGVTSTNTVSVTNSVTTIDPVRTSAAIKAIVPPVVRLAIAQKPDLKQYFVDAKVAVCTLTSSTNVSPTDLKLVVAQTKLTQLQTPEVQAAIESIFGIYSAVWGDALNKQLSSNERLAVMVPILQSICEALGEGLATQ